MAIASATTTTPTLTPAAAPVGIAPHLRQLMADYAATGLPPAYVPKDDDDAAAPLAVLEDDDATDDETAHPDEDAP